jgi:hypothetical protein
MKNGNAWLGAGALSLALLGATAATAHHGWSGYQEAESQVAGVVETASLGGPHGLLKVRTREGLWDVVLAPPRAIERSGLTMQAIPRGARVTARGHRHLQAGRLEIKTERLTVGRRTFDLYPDRP